MSNACDLTYLLLQMACESVPQRLAEDTLVTDDEEDALIVLEESDYISNGLLTTEPLCNNISELSEVKQLRGQESPSKDLPEFNTLCNPLKEHSRDGRDEGSHSGKKTEAAQQPLHEIEAMQPFRMVPERESATETNAVLKQTTENGHQNSENEMQILQKISSSTSALRQKLGDLVSHIIESRNRVNSLHFKTSIYLTIGIGIPAPADVCLMPLSL